MLHYRLLYEDVTYSDPSYVYSISCMINVILVYSEALIIHITTHMFVISNIVPQNRTITVLTREQGTTTTTCQHVQRQHQTSGTCCNCIV